MREAIVTLGDSDLEAVGFDGLVSTVGDAGIRDVELLEARGTDCVPPVEVEDRIDLDETGAFDRVTAVAFGAEKDDTHSYPFELTATALPDRTAVDHEALVGDWRVVHPGSVPTDPYRSPSE